MTNFELAKKIKELRTKKGFSQEELANQTNLSLRTIQRIEGGETEPRGDTLKRLANALAVTPNDLIEWVAQEDRGYLFFLNASALSYIAFPLLGVIVPLTLWILKRDKIKNIDEIGKKLLNFQITWCLFFFIWYLFLISSMLFGFRMPDYGIHRFSNLGQAEINLLVCPGLYYVGNFVFIIINSVRSYNGNKVFYQPAIPFLR